MQVIPAEISIPKKAEKLDGPNKQGSIVRPAKTTTLTYRGLPSKNIPIGLANLRAATTDEPSIDKTTVAAKLLM